LVQLLERLAKFRLEINFKKSLFLRKVLDYLGYSVSNKGILPNDSHIEVIKNYPVPNNTKQLLSYLGMFSYIRRFVPSYASIARPLVELLKKGGPFPTDEEQMKVFKDLRNRLSTPPILLYLALIVKRNYILTPVLEVLEQFYCRDKTMAKCINAVFYYSLKASAAESRYHSFELETLAIIYALRRFRVYLEHMPFKILTDCHSLVQTLSKKSINPRIARWSLKLENYNYKIEHRPCEIMPHVDALSRERNC